MVKLNQPVFDLRQTFVELRDGADAVPVKGGDEFWTRKREPSDPNHNQLVCVTRQAKDWKTWEMHPAGDEILYLLSGAVSVVLEESGGERRIEMGRQTACLVPSGIWHRICVHEPGEMMFITCGSGTQHRPV
jgi:mannose-6-phosphate isomerase-like protein (cupin superfamily)